MRKTYYAKVEKYWFHTKSFDKNVTKNENRVEIPSDDVNILIPTYVLIIDRAPQCAYL